MSDEQTIYISPEDDLTTVRERLEHLTTRNVTLVIPAQTQLRSHVAWKLLYARSRELNKEVLIVSSDPQVRSVAHAVKFKVAHSLESTQPGKSRPTSRPTRSNPTGKTKAPPIAPSRTASTRGPAELRGAASPRSRQQPPAQQWYPPLPEKTNAPSSFESKKSPTDETVTGGFHEPGSASFGAPDKHYTQPYDFHINTSPPIRPLSADQIEEPDLLLEDYTHAQDIRQRASSGQHQTDERATQQPSNEPAPPSNEVVPPYRMLPLPGISDDPFAYMSDSQPPPPSEQHGAVALEGYDSQEYHTIHDVSDLPTSTADSAIEYQGDSDDFVPAPSSTPITHATIEPVEPDDEPEEDGPPRRIHGVRPRRSRTGYKQQPALPTNINFDDDELPRIENQQIPQQTRPTPPNAPAYPAASEAGRPPTSLTPKRPITQQRLGQQPTTPARPTTQQRLGQQPATPGRPITQQRLGQSEAPPRLRPSAPLQSPPRQGQQRPAPRSSGRGNRRPAVSGLNRRSLRIGLVALLVVLLLGMIVLFGPSAQVTLTVAAQNYTHPISLTASTKNLPNTVPATLLQQTFSKSSSEPTTGSATEDTALASGTICITNNGSEKADIPSQLTVATANNVQFKTQEDTVIPAGFTCTADSALVINITAVKPGETGNVLAGTITIIPDDSLSQIASYNGINATDLKLAVTNEKDTSGGGVQTVKALAQPDLDNAKTDLHKQLQASITTWLNQLSKNGIVGQPTTVDTLINPPTVGTVADSSGGFTATLHSIASVLFVKQSDLQHAAISQLTTFIQHDKNYQKQQIASDTATPVNIDQLQPPTGDLAGMLLKFNATAQAIPLLKKEDIQNLINGQSVSEAQSLLKNLPDGHVLKVDIQTTPGFIPRITNWPAHINVTILPAPTPPQK